VLTALAIKLSVAHLEWASIFAQIPIHPTTLLIRKLNNLTDALRKIKQKVEDCSHLVAVTFDLLSNMRCKLLCYSFLVQCKAADGIICIETKNATFKREIPCKWT